MGEDVTLFYEDEGKFSKKLRGGQLFSYLYKFFIKHRWFKQNDYQIEENNNTISVISMKARMEESADSQSIKEDVNDSESMSVGDETENDRELLTQQSELPGMMPVIQELKVIFLNFGAICHDILKEQREDCVRFVHIYIFCF